MIFDEVPTAADVVDDPWHVDRAAMTRGHKAVADFIEQALNERRVLRDDWRDALEDALSELWRIVDRNYHPDATDKIGAAIGLLAEMWLSGEDAEDAEDIYIAGRGSEPDEPDG